MWSIPSPCDIILSMDNAEEQNARAEEQTAANLAEERIRLEREALAVERERLASARLHAEAEARLARKTRRPVLTSVAVLLFAALCFAGGLMTGVAVMENRQQRQREARLARALSQLDGWTDFAAATNAPLPEVLGDGKTPEPVRRKVAVVVIQ